MALVVVESPVFRQLSGFVGSENFTALQLVANNIVDQIYRATFPQAPGDAPCPSETSLFRLVTVAVIALSEDQKLECVASNPIVNENGWKRMDSDCLAVLYRPLLSKRAKKRLVNCSEFTWGHHLLIYS